MHFTKHWHRLLLLIPVLLLGLILTACGQSSSTSTSKLTTIKIGYMGTANSVGLAAIADQAGYFKKQDLKVKLVEFADGPSIIAAMKAGSIQIGNIGAGAHTTLAQGKAQVILMDGVSRADKLIGNKAKGVTSIKSLKGKKVAVVAGTTSQMILDAALEKAGMTEKDVTIVSMSANNIASAMATGKVDAASTWVPSTTQIESKLGSNAVTLAKDTDFSSTMPFLSSWVVTSSYAKTNKKTVVKAEKALMAAMDARAKSVKSVAKYIAKQLGSSTSDVITQLTGSEKFYTAAQIAKMAANGKLAKLYNAQQTAFIKLGLLKDTGSLKTAKDYLLTDIIKTASK